MPINNLPSVGSRAGNGVALNRLSQDFMRDLAGDYTASGTKAILDLRKNEPMNYLRLLLALRREQTESNDPQPIEPVAGEQPSKSEKEVDGTPFRFLSRRLKMQALEQELAALAAEEDSVRREAAAKLWQPPAGGDA